MSDKRRLSRFFPILVLLVLFEGQATLYSQPPPQTRGGRGQQQGISSAAQAASNDISTSLKQFKTGLSDVKNELNNHEIEIRMFEERLRTQEQMMEDLHQQFKDDLANQRNVVKADSVVIQNKVDVLDRSVKSADGASRGMMTDLRQLKDQSDEFVKILAQYKLKLVELEKLVEVQNHQMENFEIALNTVIEVLKGKDSTKASWTKNEGRVQTYKVQSGDSLEKIARKYNVSVQVLRQANQLTSDRIIIGQTLKIP